MRVYTTILPNRPNITLKVRSFWWKGAYIASASLLAPFGVVIINGEGETEHEAIHMCVDTLNDLAGCIRASLN